MYYTLKEDYVVSGKIASVHCAAPTGSLYNLHTPGTNYVND